MSFDKSSYSSLGRRRIPSYSSLSSGSSRSSFSSEYGSSSSYGFSPGLSSLGSSSSFSASGLSGSKYSSRPPSSSSFSSLSSREGSFLSTSMMKRDTIINSLVRTSHDLNRHDFLPSDAASLRSVSGHFSHHSYRSMDRSRSKTTDLSISSLTARSSTELGCFSSYTTTSGYGTTYRSTYRPILIQRPTFDNYTPRPREERQRDTHFKSIRRDRPLVKFREKEEEDSPEKVRQLLDSWSPETIEEHDEEDYETRKRDSVRSNDSGIGSFRSSFGKRSCKKSGEFLSYDLSPTIDEKDSGTEDNEDLSSDRRYGGYQRVDHVSSVDEGVHMDADFESRSPRDIVSPLGFQDTIQGINRPLSRNEIPNVLEKPENAQSTSEEIPPKISETAAKTGIENHKQSSKSPEISPDVQGVSGYNTRVRRRSDLDFYKGREKASVDATNIINNETETSRRKYFRSRGNNAVAEGEKSCEVDEVLIPKTETVNKRTGEITEPNHVKQMKIEKRFPSVPEVEVKNETVPVKNNMTLVKNEKAQIKDATALVKNEKAQIKNERSRVKDETAGVKDETKQMKDAITLVKNERVNVKNETAQVTCERAEVKNETLQIRNERARVKNETLPVKNETESVKNKIAPVKNEMSKTKDTTTLVKNERVQDKNETSQVKYERAKVKNETTQIRKESPHVKNETWKVKNETTPPKKETAAVKSETAQIKNEIAQVKKETPQVKKETSQIKTEVTPVKNESSQIKDGSAQLKIQTTHKSEAAQIKNKTVQAENGTSKVKIETARVETETAQTSPSTDSKHKSCDISTNQSYSADLLGITADKLGSTNQDSSIQKHVPQDTAEKPKKKKKVKKPGDEEDQTTKETKGSSDLQSKTTLHKADTDSKENKSLSVSLTKTAVSDLPTENKKLILEISTKPILTEKGCAHEVVGGAKLTESCTKDTLRSFERNRDAKSKLSSDVSESSGAIPKIKGENQIKRDTLGLGKTKHDETDRALISSNNQDAKQIKSLKPLVSQPHKLDDMKGTLSSPNVSDPISFSANKIPWKQQKDTIKANASTKSDIASKNIESCDKGKNEVPLREKKDTNQNNSSEEITKNGADSHINHSKIADLKVPSDSQKTDKCVKFPFDTKPPLKRIKDRSDLISLEEKSKINVSRLKTRTETDKNVLCPEQKLLKTEVNKESVPGGSTVKQPSSSKDSINLEKDISRNKTEKGVNKYMETKVPETDVCEQKKITESTKTPALTGEFKVQSTCAAPTEVTNIMTETKAKELKTVVASTTGLQDIQKAKKISEKISSGKNKPLAENNIKMLEKDSHVPHDTKHITDSRSGKILSGNGKSILQSKKRLSDAEPEAHVDAVVSKDITHHQTDNGATDSETAVPEAVETSKVSSPTEKCKIPSFGIKKSSSEDFKPGEMNSTEQSMAASFKLQKSSSADTKVLKRTKPPLPLKVVIPPGLPISRKEPCTTMNQRSEKNSNFFQLQKSSTAGKMEFSGDSPETQKLHDLKKSYTTECRGLIRKPLIKDLKSLSKPDLPDQKKSPMRKAELSALETMKVNKITCENSVDKKSAVLKPETQSPEDKKIEPFGVLATCSTAGDKDISGQKLKAPVTSHEHEIKEHVKPSKDKIDANSMPTVENPASDQSKVESNQGSVKGLFTTEEVSKNSHCLEAPSEIIGSEAEQGDILKASSDVKDVGIPTPRVARPYVPKNRLILSKSDTNVPMRQLMTSSSAPNIAVEMVRAKLAKKLDSSEVLRQIERHKLLHDSKGKSGEAEEIKESGKIDHSAKANAQAPNASVLPLGNTVISPAVSESDKVTLLETKQKILSESAVTSQDIKICEKKVQHTETKSSLETSTTESSPISKIHAEKKNVHTKGDRQSVAHSSDDHDDSSFNRKKGSLKVCSVSETLSTGIKPELHSETNSTETVKISETLSCTTNSIQDAALVQEHLEQSVTTQNVSQCIQSEQNTGSETITANEAVQRVSGNVPLIKESGGIPATKEPSNDDKIIESVSIKLPMKQDVPGKGTLDTTTSVEEVKPKIKKAKKPKAEGDEKVVKKKKKKKEKLDATDEKSGVKEKTESDGKSSEPTSISVPTDTQGFPKGFETTSEPRHPSSSDAISQECQPGSQSLDSTTPDAIHSEQKSECKTNCHKKCEKSVPHLCGVNEKLLSEVLATVKKEKADLASPSPGVINEASANTDTSAVNICSPTPPQSPAISDPEDACDHLWSENKRSESREGFRQSRNSSSVNSGTIRFKQYSVDDFHFLKVLGRGSYGKVMLAELKGNGQYFAVKCLKKDVVLEDNDVECTMIEKKVLAMGSNHPYLCTLLCTFQSQSHLFFVMEYLCGGDLMFHIQQSGKFDQERARFYAAEIVCALKYLHKRGIVYRDAKLDNICLDAEGHIRLVDFGFCKLRIYRKECLPRNLCGTPDYMAPEIIKGLHYNQSVDWWSFGVLLYEMLIGQSPFNGTDEAELFWSVCNEEAYYPRFISKEAKQLLVLLLEKNAEKRLGMPGCVAGDICQQPFFRHTNWEKVEKRELDPPFKPKLKSATDVSNFDSDFTMEKAMLTPIDQQILDSMDQNQFDGFSYTNPRITD